MNTINSELMSALCDAEQTQGYVKAGFLGFAKSGKSFTAALLACAIRQHFQMDGPISMYDTETGSIYLRDLVSTLTGKELLAKKARSFEVMMSWASACVQAGVSVAIVDSITHPWRELCDSYLEQVNEWRVQKRWQKQKRLEFQDWNVIKPRWQRWSDFYLNSPLHIIICGRAGWEYEMEARDDGSNKKDLIKTGVKMKTEAEFGFEPSLLVEMQREQDLNSGHRIIRTATVLGDRFSKIDGAGAIFPSTNDPAKAMEAVYTFFRPHLQCLSRGSHATVDTAGRTNFDINDQGEDGWAAERKQRTILCEEIQGLLLAHYPSQSAADKRAKVSAIEKHLGTRSWTAVEALRSEVLRQALQSMRQSLEHQPPSTTPDEEAHVA